MKIEQQVCTRFQAKRLKELGVRKESAFYWRSVILSKDEEMFVLEYGLNFSIDGHDVPAFTVAELGEMLPCRVWIEGRMYQLNLVKADKNWHEQKYNTPTSYHYQYEYVNKDDMIELLGGKQISESTEASARAAMLIYLLENNSHKIQP